MKSSFSGDSSCVEVELAWAPGEVAVWDSKDREGPELVFSHDEWEAFLKGAKAGEFDL